MDIRHSWILQQKTTHFFIWQQDKNNLRLNGRETSSNLQNLDSGQSWCWYILVCMCACMHTSLCMYTYSWWPVWVKKSRWVLLAKENKKLQRRAFNAYLHCSPEDSTTRQAKPSELDHENWSFEMETTQHITDWWKIPKTKGSYTPVNITPAASEIL